MRTAIGSIACVLVAAATASPQEPATATLLASTWTGHSLCVDKARHPACKDETIVYRFVPAGPHATTLYADKILDGKRVPMGALEMHLGAGDRSASAHFTWGTTTGTWAYTMTSDTTLRGTLHVEPGDALVRNVDARRVADKDVPAAPPLAEYGTPH